MKVNGAGRLRKFFERELETLPELAKFTPSLHVAVAGDAPCYLTLFARIPNGEAFVIHNKVDSAALQDPEFAGPAAKMLVKSLVEEIEKRKVQNDNG